MALPGQHSLVEGAEEERAETSGEMYYLTDTSRTSVTPGRDQHLFPDKTFAPLRFLLC